MIPVHKIRLSGIAKTNPRMTPMGASSQRRRGSLLILIKTRSSDRTCVEQTTGPAAARLLRLVSSEIMPALFGQPAVKRNEPTPLAIHLMNSPTLIRQDVLPLYLLIHVKAMVDNPCQQIRQTCQHYQLLICPKSIFQTWQTNTFQRMFRQTHFQTSCLCHTCRMSSFDRASVTSLGGVATFIPTT